MMTGVSDNMRYRVSPTKRKRCRSRSSDQSSLQLPGFYDDQAAVLLNVKVINNTPPAPVRHSSLNRFQMIIAQQQKQVNAYLVSYKHYITFDIINDCSI